MLMVTGAWSIRHGPNAYWHRSTASCHELLCIALDQCPVGQFGPPSFRYPLFTIISTRKLPIDGPCCVGILPEVDGKKTAFFKIHASVERPKRGLQRLNHITPSSDLGRIPEFVRPGGDLIDLRCERMFFPITGRRAEALRQQLLFGCATYGSHQQCSQIAAGIHGGHSPMGGPRTGCFLAPSTLSQSIFGRGALTGSKMTLSIMRSSIFGFGLMILWFRRGTWSDSSADLTMTTRDSWASSIWQKPTSARWQADCRSMGFFVVIVTPGC
jgi:hypothetical protein